MSKEAQFYGELIYYQITVADWKVRRWCRQLRGYYVFYFALLDSKNKDCPTGPTLDADCGEVPMLLRIISYGRPRDVAVAVQKSGFFSALDCDNGDKDQEERRGAASDGRCVYTNIPTLRGFASPLHHLPKQQLLVHGWLLIQILGRFSGPQQILVRKPRRGQSRSVVNGVLFKGSVASKDPLYAMDANNGAILWMNNTRATIDVGVSASYACIYHGNGYTAGLAKFHPTWTGGNSLFAFHVL
ncbi:hypothetical protein LguiA_030003 [Lonicera macranthoides]